MHIIQAIDLQVTESKGWIDIRGSNFDSALYIRGVPHIYNWSDCEGSVGQCLIRLAKPESHEASQLFAMHMMSPTLENSVSLEIVSGIVSSILAPSKYRLSLVEDKYEGDYESFTKSWRTELDFTAFYPVWGSFIATLPNDLLNESRIAYYEKQIISGLRPIMLVITVAEGWCHFILDGHHKFEAYCRTRIPMRYIEIARIDSPVIDLDSQANMFPLSHPQRVKAMSVKSKYDSTITRSTHI